MTHEKYIEESSRLKYCFLDGVDSKLMRPLVKSISKHLHSKWSEFAESNELDKRNYYNMSLCAELLDQFGEHREAVNLLSVAAPDILSFESTKIQSQHEPKCLREIIRLYAVYAMIVFYRNNKFEYALDRIEYSIKSLLTISNASELPSCGTFAQLYYMNAMCLRKLHRFKEAEDNFRLSIIKYYEMGTKQAANLPIPIPQSLTSSQDKLSAKVLFSQTRLSIVIAKFAWMLCQRGHIARAETITLLSQTLILKSNDELHKAYIDIIHASILRHKHSNEDKYQQGYLKQCEELIIRSENVLKEWEFSSYYYHALHEKAQIILAKAQFYRSATPYKVQSDADNEHNLQEMDHIVGKLRDYGNKISNTMVKAKAEYLQVMLCNHRHEYKQAITIAEDSLRLKDLSKNTQIDFRLACVESYLSIEPRDEISLANARNHLNAVFSINNNMHLDMTGQSLLTSARYYLLYAKYYILNYDLNNAREYIEKWKSIEMHVEVNYIRLLGNQVTEAFKQIDKRAYIIEINNSNSLSYEEHNKGIKKFLVAQAYDQARKDIANTSSSDRKKAVTKEMVASLLKISRATLIQWEKDLDIHTSSFKS